MKKKQLTTEKRLGVQLYLVLFLYTVTGIGLEILAEFIFPKFDSKILSWLYLCGFSIMVSLMTVPF